MLDDYEFHPEAKCADASGAPCDKQSVGLLQRRHVTIEWPPHFIGKESNKLEEVEEGGAPDAGDVYTEYPDARRDKWTTQILPVLQSMNLAELQRLSGLDRRSLQRIRSGRRPQAKNRALLSAIALAPSKALYSGERKNSNA